MKNDGFQSFYTSKTCHTEMHVASHWQSAILPGCCKTHYIASSKYLQMQHLIGTLYIYIITFDTHSPMICTAICMCGYYNSGFVDD